MEKVNDISFGMIGNPEFIDLEPLDISPFISKCTVKVLYVGQNRNGSDLKKPVCTEMAKTLRGCPIVGWYREDIQDFGDHGQQIVVDGTGVHFNCLTKPYGFVAPDAEVWYQNFVEEDGTVHEYMLTNGYLWTQQFEELDELKAGSIKGQSMELDSETVQGQWTKDAKSDTEFFIITDAIFSKLCILGDAVEPCFEGASIAVASNFTAETKPEDYTGQVVTTLHSMMQELKFALQEGGQQTTMENLENTTVDNVDTVVQEQIEETVVAEPAPAPATFSLEEKTQLEEALAAKTEELDALATKFAVLSEQYTVSQEELEAAFAKLKAYEDEQKDSMIASFAMLTDEEKEEVVQNKSTLTVDEIESKLSVIYARKQKKDAEESAAEPAPTIFSLSSVEEKVPDWVQALRNNEKK